MKFVIKIVFRKEINMLYKKNSEPKLALELFKNPTAEYRGTPFWSWNCKLDQKELDWQLEILRKWALAVRICTCAPVWKRYI